MKVAVVGLWHLGLVTAGCLAHAGHEVLAYDPDPALIQSLQNNQTPIFEPGLDDLLQQAQSKNNLHYSATAETLKSAEVVWITFDTPVDDNDVADVNTVMQAVEAIFPHLQNHTLVLISSQLPVGTTRQLQKRCEKTFPTKQITFACSPENLRLGKAIDVFTNPDRVIVGLQTDSDKSRIQTLLRPFTDHLIWMSIESAEMTKHALNAFLSTSVVFINEIATLCERVGADAREVELGLKSEERIGRKAYLRPGNAIGGGTLARDVNYLVNIGNQQHVKTPLFSSLLDSNHHHKQWSCRKVLDILKDLKNKTVTTLGLTYKAGTNTLRRSTAVETCRWLNAQGAKVMAFDPAVKQLPDDLSQFIELKPTLTAALQGSHAVIVATEWPEFTSLNAETLTTTTEHAFVFDPSGYLAKTLSEDKRIRYFTVGRQA